VVAHLPPFLFVFAWALAVIGLEAPGTDGSTPFDELALRWMLFFGMGMSILGGAITHTVFAKDTAKAIGWETNGSVRGRVRQPRDRPRGHLCIGRGRAEGVGGGLDRRWPVLLLAGLNHIVEIVRDKNYAPGNTAILLSDLGVPISLLVLLISTGAI
jgi:hypothetical protein